MAISEVQSRFRISTPVATAPFSSPTTRGQRLRQGVVFNPVVPTAAQRSGNYGNKTIYDPLTIATVTAANQAMYPGFALGSVGKIAFPNNTIPTARLSPQALAIQAYEPMPNTASNTFSSVPSQAIDFDQYTIRLDHQINAANRLFARWIYVTNREIDPNASPLLKTASLTSIGQDIALGLITNLGANKVNEARVHYLPSHVRLNGFLQGS